MSNFPDFNSSSSNSFPTIVPAPNSEGGKEANGRGITVEKVHSSSYGGRNYEVFKQDNLPLENSAEGLNPNSYSVERVNTNSYSVERNQNSSSNTMDKQENEPGAGETLSVYGQDESETVSVENSKTDPVDDKKKSDWKDQIPKIIGVALIVLGFALSIAAIATMGTFFVAVPLALLGATFLMAGNLCFEIQRSPHPSEASEDFSLRFTGDCNSYKQALDGFETRTGKVERTTLNDILKSMPDHKASSTLQAVDDAYQWLNAEVSNGTKKNTLLTTPPPGDAWKLTKEDLANEASRKKARERINKIDTSDRTKLEELRKPESAGGMGLTEEQAKKYLSYWKNFLLLKIAASENPPHQGLFFEPKGS